MFKKLSQNKKAQQTAEYAILIALVVGAVIAMQTYAQRTIQARIRGASMYLSRGADEPVAQNVLGTDLQYEPYYLSQQYNVTRDEQTTEIQDPNRIGKEQGTMRARAKDGFQQTTWNGSGTW